MVARTLIDTSSLIELCVAQSDIETPKGATLDFWRAHGASGIDGAIEAIILYDELVFDGPSFRRNVERLPQLEKLSQFGTLFGEDNPSLEHGVYTTILQRYVPQIDDDPDPEITDFSYPFGGAWAGWDLGLERGYYSPSCTWRDIESELTGDAAVLARSLRERLGEHTPLSGAACALLVRTLYYEQLQKVASANLVLHPEKGRYLGTIRYREPLKSVGGASNILSIFDKRVRRAFYKRKEEWLGREDLEYEVPMLTSFVLKKCKSWRDLISVLEEVRESKEAWKFREAVGALLDAALNRRNQEVDEILSQLKAAGDEWATDLRQTGLKKRINVTIPILGIGAEFDVPDAKLTKSVADRILVFVHSILSET